MATNDSRGLILYNRNYRENDKLVKIFTETAGKRMFFVKNASKSKLLPVIQPLTQAEFFLTLNDVGLSYINDYRSARTYPKINGDIFKLAYASYITALADAALTDNIPDAPLFAFLCKTLDLMEAGLDTSILTNIFEIQILSRFGVQINFSDCAVCHRSGQAFDFSFRYSGLLCPSHYQEDLHRSHLNPNIPYLVNRFQNISLQELKTISLSPELKLELRQFIDQIYDDYVGLHLKSKKFIDDLQNWGDMMKKEQWGEEITLDNLSRVILL